MDLYFFYCYTDRENKAKLNLGGKKSTQADRMPKNWTQSIDSERVGYEVSEAR